MIIRTAEDADLQREWTGTTRDEVRNLQTRTMIRDVRAKLTAPVPLHRRFLRSLADWIQG